MKLRLEELQQQVTKQEREALRLQKRNNHYASGNSSSTAISKGAHDTNGNANGTTDPVDGSSVDTPHTPEYTFEISHLLPGGTNADPSSAKPAHVPASPPPLSPEKGFGQTSRVDQDGFHPSFTNISLPNSPPFPSNLPGQTKRGSARGSEPIPYPYSVPNYACPTLRMQAEFMQDRFLQDCFMQYHNHPGSRIMESDPSINYRDLSNQTGLAGASHVVGTEDSHPRRAPDLKGMSEPTSQDPIRIPPIGDDSWKPVVLAEPRRGPSLPPPDGERPTRAYSDSTDSKAGKQSIRTSSSSGTSDSPWGMQESNPLGKDATLEDRFEYVLECAKQVGFDWFDSLVANYYTADFSDRSILSNEQRLSRNRRLPGILAELREKSKGWTQWERQGYEDEILKSAESILVAECNTFKHSRNFQDGSLEDDSGKNEGGTRSSSSGPGSGSATPAIKRIFQNEVRRTDGHDRDPLLSGSKLMNPISFSCPTYGRSSRP